MRARLPKGRGLWPAFWLLHNQENGTRPEIDVVELIGDKPEVVYQTYHYFDNWNLRSTPSYQAWGPDYSQSFHTYGMKWEPGRISWYVDGRVTNTFSDSNVSSEDMYILVNLAVGGSWPGSPDGSTSFPARFAIDYIRAYSPG
jgi:beta-glucanase (GH16 family)